MTQGNPLYEASADGQHFLLRTYQVRGTTWLKALDTSTGVSFPGGLIGAYKAGRSMVRPLPYASNSPSSGHDLQFSGPEIVIVERDRPGWIHVSNDIYAFET